ncbi:MAG TPA: M15 family metallopeptidase [Capsulimonadaceae bacterium]|jgi:D-alanyl-D-alanine dipeptidase
MAKIEKLGSPEPFHLINKIPIRDIGEPLFDLRNKRETRFLALAPGCLPYVREGVFTMLKRAQSFLPWEYHIRISTALRTLEMQERLYWRYYHQLEADHPEWPLSALRRSCNKFFAPPDAKAPPGHTTGGAVDVTLVNLAGQPYDLTSPYMGWDAAYTFVDGLTPEAQHNRDLLYNAMFRAGFSNCRDEWWHWSYGDSAWAVRTCATEACYGLIAPPPDYSHVPHRKRALTGWRKGMLTPDRYRRR